MNLDEASCRLVARNFTFVISIPWKKRRPLFWLSLPRTENAAALFRKKKVGGGNKDSLVEYSMIIPRTCGVETKKLCSDDKGFPAIQGKSMHEQFDGTHPADCFRFFKFSLFTSAIDESSISACLH